MAKVKKNGITQTVLEQDVHRLLRAGYERVDDSELYELAATGSNNLVNGVDAEEQKRLIAERNQREEGIARAQAEALAITRINTAQTTAELYELQNNGLLQTDATINAMNDKLRELTLKEQEAGVQNTTSDEGAG
jgi:hypothetical protein